MKQIPDMENKLENALNSLDGIQRAAPRPYFYTRLKARMARQDREWGGSLVGVISKPLFAFAVVCAVLLVNSWIFFKSDITTTAVNGTSVVNSTDIPDEYNVAVNTFYNYETP